MTGLPTPPPGWSLLLDVGRDQGHIDVPALVAAGVSGLYIRATDGEHDVDPRCIETAASCVREGLPCGLYGVGEPYGLSRAKTQADHFVSFCKDLGAALPPWLDFELAKGITAQAALDSAVAWRDDVQAALQQTVMVYAGPAFLLQLERMAGAPGMAAARALAKSPLAVAHYTGNVGKLPLVPAPWTSWTIWQASGDKAATLPWAPHLDVDVDYYRGDVSELVALASFDAATTLDNAPIVSV